MTNRERFFLLLTVVGFVVPNVFVGVFIAEHGVDPGHYLNDWFETLPAAQLSADLAIVVIAFWVWTAWEGARIGERRWWVVVPATALVGLCFAVPLFLLLRERRLARPKGLGESAAPAAA